VLALTPAPLVLCVYSNQHRSKRLEEYGHYIEGIKEKQRERKELKKKILTMQRANNEMQVRRRPPCARVSLWQPSAPTTVLFQDKLADSEEALSEQKAALATTSESLLALQQEKAAEDQKSLELLSQLQVRG